MDLDFSPYATGGAQARSDSFTRLDPNFATGVYGLTQAAHAAGIPLQITSAYRSPPTQARIVADGMAKYGLGDRADAWRADVARLGPVAAGQQWRPEMREAGLTRFIAMPGGSQHQRGTAVDFALNGSLIRDADSPAAQFIRNNAEQYGLSVPMSWEPWQVEPVGSRDGSRPQAALNFRGAPQMAMQPTQPQGLLGQLGIQRQDPTAQGETALPFYQRDRFSNTMGNLAMAFNSLRQNPDENIPRIVTGQRAAREQDAANNRTVEWLNSQPGGERFAGLVESIGAAGALQAYQQAQPAPAYRVVRGAELGFEGPAADRLYNVAPDGKTTAIGGGDINAGTPQSVLETTFMENTGRQTAEETSDVVIAGASAQRSLGQIDVLENALFNSPSGAQAALVSFAGDLGIELEGADFVQTANAIISQLVPGQRPPGSGQMSDADLALFKRSLPRLINTREGNLEIISTMRAMAEYDVARAQIARQLQFGDLALRDAAAAYDALGNPLQLYRDRAAGRETDGATPAGTGATPPPDGGLTPAELEYLGVTNG
jgi:hypothetical protein